MFIGLMKSGEGVYGDHASIIEKGLTNGQIKTVLAKIDSEKREEVYETVDLGIVIGGSVCVKTNSDDEIVYAKRPKKTWLTRFVKNREKEPCSCITLLLRRVPDSKRYMLVAGYIGSAAPAEPGDKNATPASEEFWKNHALIYGSKKIVPGSEVTF